MESESKTRHAICRKLLFIVKIELSYLKKLRLAEQQCGSSGFGFFFKWPKRCAQNKTRQITG